MDAVTKAPVIHHFSETISGFVTIRCFGQEARFVETNVDRVNSNLRMDFHNAGANEWIGFRLEMIGAVVLCSSALLLVTLSPNYVQPGKSAAFEVCKIVDLREVRVLVTCNPLSISLSFCVKVGFEVMLVKMC